MEFALSDRWIAERSALCTRWLCRLVLAGIGMYAGGLLAAPGDLDPAFGDHGRIQLPFDGGDDWYVAGAGPAIVQQSDGRVLVARTDWTSSSGSDSEITLARLRTDGTLDPDYGIGGLVRLRFRTGEAAGVSGLALLPDGRLVVVGYSIKAWLEGGMGQYPNLDTGIALVRTDGSLDPDGFGNGGRMTLDLSEDGRPDYAVATVALDDGSFIVAGTAESASGTRFLMVRMTTRGNLDPAFGEHDGFAWSNSITSLAGFHRTASGQFVACGSWYAGPAPEGRMVWFDSAGDLLRETNLASVGIEYLTACTPQPNGRIVVGGYSPAGTWLARVNGDGQLDPAFGEAPGRIPVACRNCGIWDRLGYTLVPTDIAVLADGRLSVGLYGHEWGHLAVLSFAPDGRATAGSTSLLSDRFYDMGWRELPPSAGTSKLLLTEEGDQYALVAGSASTTVIRLQGSAGPGASVIGLLGDFTQQSEAASGSLLVCRSGSSEGAVSVNAATRDDTARSPDDYVAFTVSIHWGDGESGCREIPVKVNVDDRPEPIESLWIELTDTTGAGLGMDKARLYIMDAQTTTPVPPPVAGPEPTPRGASNRGGGGAAGSALLLMLAALACFRRRTQRPVYVPEEV